MILKRIFADMLVMRLRIACPVDTGNLRDNGVQAAQKIPRGYVIQIGVPSTKLGAPATEDYALYTEVKNKSSLGWVKRSCKIWANHAQSLMSVHLEGSVNQDEL